MREDDRDLVALFADEPMPARNDALVASVTREVVRLQRRRVALMSVGGLALGLGGGAVMALCAPLLDEASRIISEAMRAPDTVWMMFAAGLALAVGVPLWRGR